MRKMRLMLLVLAAAMLCTAVVSCSKDYTGKEKTHPVFVKASTAQNSGDYAEAAKLYEEFLLVAPKSAETHMRLAALYGDNLASPVKAIYHYEKVIELRPDDSVNNDNIRSFISVCKAKLYDQLKNEYRDTEKENAVKAELAKTKDLLQKYRDYSAKLRAAYNKCRQAYIRLARSKRANAAKAKAPAVKKGSPVKTQTSRKTAVKAGAEKKAAVARQSTVKAGNIQKKHIVKKGETLHGIARMHYGNARYYKLIAEANKGKLPANLGVRIGQVLVIPPKPAK